MAKGTVFRQHGFINVDLPMATAPASAPLKQVFPMLAFGLSTSTSFLGSLQHRMKGDTLLLDFDQLGGLSPGHGDQPHLLQQVGGGRRGGVGDCH